MPTDSDTRYVDHAYFYFAQRRIVVVDDEGYDEEVRFRFDEDGCEGFHGMVNMLQEGLPAESRTYCFD